MQVEWAANNSTYTLICACRYINFPAADESDDNYLQPISGNVLVEIDGRFYLAYVSAHLTKHGTQKTELILKDAISLFDLKRYTLIRNKGRSFIADLTSVIKSGFLVTMHFYLRMATAPFNYFFKTDEFHRIVNLNAKCMFFTYDDK